MYAVPMLRETNSLPRTHENQGMQMASLGSPHEQFYSKTADGEVVLMLLLFCCLFPFALINLYQELCHFHVNPPLKRNLPQE